MVHAELRFSYRNPARCVKAGVFGYGGDAFKYAEARDAVKLSQPFWHPFSPALGYSKTEGAIRYLDARPLTAH